MNKQEITFALEDVKYVKTKILSVGSKLKGNSLKNLLFETGGSSSPLILRIFVALVIFPHGAQKALGWFGGFGFEGSMKYFSEVVKLPWLIGFLVIVIEFIGPIALLFGWATRVWSTAIAMVMTGIILTHFTDYYFMNWFGTQPAEGAEYFLLVIGMTLALTLSGGGKYSIDRSVFLKKASTWK